MIWLCLFVCNSGRASATRGPYADFVGWKGPVPAVGRPLPAYYSARLISFL